MSDLTPHEIDQLLAFRGYGNPSGQFWFIGMEEGGGDLESLRIRANSFSNLEDLAESHRKFESHDMAKSTSTWRIMSAIVGRINGIENWWDTAYTSDYQMNHLGRLDGETYLTEVLPLPKRSLADWPYGNVYESPDDYFEQVFPNQVESLQAEYAGASPGPEFVFCYGKQYWQSHSEIFGEVEFRPGLNGKIQWGRNHSTIFILTNFFGYGWTGFSESFVDELCEFAVGKIRG